MGIQASQLKPVGAEFMEWIKTNILDPRIKIPVLQRNFFNWKTLKMHEAKRR